MVSVRANTAGTDALRRAIADLKRKELRVGWFDTARYQDGTPVAYVATIQEFGHRAIPPRPFMRQTIAEQRAAWQASLKAGSRHVMTGALSVDQLLGQFGMAVAGEIATTISRITHPPLSPRTIAARQAKKKTPGVSVKPLVDTGLLIQSVSSQVIDK
jgi:hypothetical protein